MNDVLALLLLIRQLSQQINQAGMLLERMREEGRDTLTPEEWDELKGADDEARSALVEAIERAKAEGR